MALAAGAAISILTRRRKIVVVHRPEPAVDGTAAAAPAPSLMSHPVVERVVDALVAVAAAKVVGVLSEMLPDFNQHFAMDEPVPGRANGATASPEAIERRFNTAAAPH